MAKTIKNILPEIVEEPVKAPRAKKKTKTGKVFNCDLLNVRENATTASNVIRIIPNGTMVEILDEENDFYKIDGGFVMKSYIEI